MGKHHVNFTRYRLIVRTRKLVVVSVAALLLALSAVYAIWSAFHPLYKSTCSIKFEKELTLGDLFSRTITLPEGDNIETQQAIITSYDLLADVAKKLSLITQSAQATDPEVYSIVDNLIKKVHVEREKSTNIINISVTDRDPAFAQKITNELTETYIRQHNEQQQRRLTEVIKYIKEQLHEVRDKLKQSEEQFNGFSQSNQLISIDHQSENLLLQKKELEDAIRVEGNNIKGNQLKLEFRELDGKINALMGKKLEFNKLKKEVESLRNMASFLEEKNQEAMIRLAEKPNEIEIVKRAQLSTEPVNPPKIIETCLIGLITGLVLGLIIAFISEILGSSAGLIEEIENDLKLKVIGVIPQTDINKVLEGIKRSQDKDLDEFSWSSHINLVSHFAPRTMIAESFRSWDH